MIYPFAGSVLKAIIIEPVRVEIESNHQKFQLKELFLYDYVNNS